MGLFNKVAKFLREVRAELRKVVWPTQKETMVSTVVVLVAIAMVAMLFWILDSVFAEIVALLLR